MRHADSIASLRSALAPHRGATIGFVPTMGNLHDGHLKLVAACRAQCDVSVVSIYVNPLQFGPGEDYASYPRTLDEDRTKLAEAGVDFLFTPDDGEFYPDGRTRQTQVVVPGLSEILCGRSRPGHFNGVATIVLKLFNIVQPDRAYFGEKDYQQLTLLRTAARHLNVPVQIVGVPTERAPSGLALSSRNQYLTAAESNVAPVLYRTLCDLGHRLAQGERDFPALEQRALRALAEAGFEPEYCAVRNPQNLAEPGAGDMRFVVLAAARLGRARLIDNVHIDLESDA